MFNTDGVLTPVSAENDMVQGLCIAHTDVTMNCGKYCSSSILSPVFDRHIESYSHSHRTAPSACTVLSAPVGAFSVSDTGSCTSHRIVTALRLWLVRCYVRLLAHSVSPTLPLALSNYEFSSDPTTHIPPHQHSLGEAAPRRRCA